MASSQPSHGEPPRDLPPNIVEVVESHLRASAYPSLRNVCCVVEDGTLILRGYVATYFLKQAAQELANHADGVNAVDNQIEVYFSGWSTEIARDETEET